MRQGVEFDADIFRELAGYAPETGWVFVAPELRRDDAVAETVAAMSDGAGVIAGSWLPIDGEGRRTGKPDLLIRRSDGYVPVDVKHHLTLDVSDDAPATTSPLADPFLDASGFEEGWSLRKRKDDALQLAHYRRMLEKCGFAADSPMAGIVGKERIVAWYDLDAPMWQTPAKSDGRKRKMRSSMEVYDFEFDFRLDIAAVAYQHQEDPSVDLLVLPVRRSECAACPWRDICNVDLEAGNGDPSLLQGVRFEQWRTLREHGITDRFGVAKLDYPTAKLSADGVNLQGLIANAAAADPGTPVDDLLSRAPKQLAAAQAAGLETAGDVLEHVDYGTASLNGGRWLSRAIIGARAVLGEAPAYLKPDRPAALPPRADIEIDIDMENTNDGVYLWGAQVTDRAGLGLVEAGYHSFSTWEQLTEESELMVFREFWTWLSGVRTAAADHGASVAGYCWHEQAENTQMRRIAAPYPQLAAAVEDFISSDAWIDMMKVFDRSWTTGGSISLKAIAPLSGFGWPVDDPGGGVAMVYHARMLDQTTSPDERTKLLNWLLDYNRGDVEATLAIRRWLGTEGSHLPVVPNG
jgi:predicted RecB family nuclease